MNECPPIVLAAHWHGTNSVGMVAWKRDTGRSRNTYIREDLKLCTHGSPQDRSAYSTMSMLDSLCALCWMHLCDGTVDSALVACCGLYHTGYSTVAANPAFSFNAETRRREYACLFPYAVHPIWFMNWYEFIHYSYWLRGYYHFPIRLATDTINIMKSQFAQGIAAAVKSGHNWLVSTGTQYTGDKH